LDKTVLGTSATCVQENCSIGVIFCLPLEKEKHSVIQDVSLKVS